MKEFVKIAGERIRKNTIKRYAPYGETSLNVYYNTSRYKMDLQTFKFASAKERDDMVDTLDLAFGIFQ